MFADQKIYRHIKKNYYVILSFSLERNEQIYFDYHCAKTEMNSQLF